MKNMIKLLPVMAAVILMVMPAGASAYWGGYTWYTPYTYKTTAPVSSAPAASVKPANTAATSTSTTQSPTEQTLLTLLNKERTQRGLRPLQLDSQLTSLARLKSQDMVAKRYFSHTSPTYGTPAQMLARYSVRYNLFGENIAQGSSAAQIHTMWMNSPGHRANILNPQFTHIGIGVAGSGTLAATQLFISR